MSDELAKRKFVVITDPEATDPWSAMSWWVEHDDNGQPYLPIYRADEDEPRWKLRLEGER